MPSAAASFSRVPDGRLSSTRRRMSLVVCDIAVAGAACLLAMLVRHELTVAIAALSRATAIGATERVVKPGREQRLRQARIGRRVAAERDLDAARASGLDGPRDQRQHRRIAGIVEVGDRADVARRGHRVLGQVVGADRIERGAEILCAKRRRRDLDHDAERRAGAGDPFRLERRELCVKHGARAVEFRRARRSSAASPSARRARPHAHSARSCTRNTSGRASDSRMPRRPRNGLLSPSTVKPAIGLSPPASRVRIVTGLPSAQSRMRR